MRIVIRVLAGLVVLIVLAGAALLLGLPSLLGSDAVRARIEDAGSDATGRTVRYAELGVGLFPPRVVIREPQLLVREGGETLFAAKGVSLVVELGPLLKRKLVVESVVVEGATTRLLLTADGLVHPFRAPEEEEPPEVREPSDPNLERDEREDLRLELRRIVLRDSRVVLEDQTLAAPAVLEFRELEGHAEGETMGDRLDFELAGALAAGGRFRATGRRESKNLTVDVELDRVEIGAMASYLQRGQRASGAASGSMALVRNDGEPTRLSLDLVVDEGEIAAEDLDLQGRFRLKANLEEGEDRTEGTFEVDATDATIRYGSGFAKPPGQAATARGRLIPGEGGIRLEDTEIKIRNFEAEVQLDTGARNRATISAPPFDLEGWQELVPALEGLAVKGPLAIPELRILTDPLEFRGRFDLSGLQLSPSDRAPLRFQGSVLAVEGGLRTSELVVLWADQTFRIDGQLSGLAASPRFQARVSTEAADSAALLRALTGSDEDTLEGPLDLSTRISGPLQGDQPFAERLEGSLRFEISPGRLQGISLLRSTFDQLGEIGEVAERAGREKGGKSLQRLYDDRFESLSGTLSLAGGRARTNDLRLVYDHYTVDLRGEIGLVDRSLDLTGELTIYPEVDEMLASDAGAASGKRRVIPLAGITGTLDAPRVKVHSDDALRFAALYASQHNREKWERAIDERLGDGAGREVLDELERILIGKPR